MAAMIYFTYYMGYMRPLPFGSFNVAWLVSPTLELAPRWWATTAPGRRYLNAAYIYIYIYIPVSLDPGADADCTTEQMNMFSQPGYDSCLQFLQGLVKKQKSIFYVP